MPDSIAIGKKLILMNSIRKQVSTMDSGSRFQEYHLDLFPLIDLNALVKKINRIDKKQLQKDLKENLIKLIQSNQENFENYQILN